MSSEEEEKTAYGFKIGDKVVSELGAEGVVEDIIEIQGKPYILVRWRTKSKGAYGKEEIKRYGLRKAPT